MKKLFEVLDNRDVEAQALLDSLFRDFNGNKNVFVPFYVLHYWTFWRALLQEDSFLNSCLINSLQDISPNSMAGYGTNERIKLFFKYCLGKNKTLFWIRFKKMFNYVFF